MQRSCRLRVFSGPFDRLEEAFLRRLLEAKKDPWNRMAVVSASSRLLQRLETRIAQSGAALLNIHFHTFSSLADNVVQQAGGLEKPLRQDTLFFDTLVKQIIRDERPFELLREIAVPQGFPSAVRGTLRDLLDAGVNADNVGSAIEEEFAETNLDLGSLRSLLNLHRLYLRRVGELPVSLRIAHLIERAIEQAPESDFLASFSEILYYGFYDLTGLQTDFFQAVVKHHPSTLFFPFIKDNPSYSFASRFRDTFLQPVLGEEIILETPTPSPFRERVGERATRIWNVSGTADEAWLIAAQIRRLHDFEEKVPFLNMRLWSCEIKSDWVRISCARWKPVAFHFRARRKYLCSVFRRYGCFTIGASRCCKKRKKRSGLSGSA